MGAGKRNIYIAFAASIIFSLFFAHGTLAISCGSCAYCDCCGAGFYCGHENTLGYKLGNEPSCATSYLDERFMCFGGVWYECDPDENWGWNPLIDVTNNQNVGLMYCCFDNATTGHWSSSPCGSGSMHYNPDYNPAQSVHLNVPTEDVITSSDGHVTIGVGKRYGGAIVYYRDDRLPNSDQMPLAPGNIIDYSNGGTLLTTAIWTLPDNVEETRLCPASSMVNGTCPGTIPFNNPTQGGYTGNGYAGNPNPVNVSINNNKIHVSYRAVNYNFAWPYTVKFPNETNVDEWQTDMWGDIEISFHPLIPDVVVIDSTITYCKGMSSRCNNKKIVTQDNQLMTFFGAGEKHPDHAFRGPYGRAVYMNLSGYKYQGPDVEFVGWDYQIDNTENWVAMLQTNYDGGVGMSIQKYQASAPESFGYTAGSWPLMNAIQPELNKFERNGITRKNKMTVDGREFGDIPRYEFDPGGWYKFRTYMATGSVGDIRDKLMKAQGVAGYVDLFSCEYIGGWAIDTFDPSRRVHIKVYAHPYYNYSDNETVSKETEANVHRSDLVSHCSGGNCSFGLTISRDDLPYYFSGRKLQIEVYGIASDGREVKLAYDVRNSIIQPCQVASPADINQDNKVDIDDLILVASDFSKKITDTAWDPAKDIIGDGVIDIFDIIYVASRFSQG